MVSTLSKPAQACGVSAPVRFSWPASFERFSVFRFFYLAIVFNLFAVALSNEKTYYANSEARSCVCSGTYEEGKDYFPHKVDAEFSDGLWEVTYHNSYKKLTTYNKDGSSDVWYLVLCGTPLPAEATDPVRTIEIPIKTVMIDSSTQIHLLEYLGQRDALAEWRSLGCDDPNTYCSGISAVNPCLNLQVDEGLTREVLDAEDVKADLVIGAATAFGESAGFQVDCTDKPVFRIRQDTADRFGTLEYVEALSVFFNREQAANALVRSVRERYECSQAKATALPSKSTLSFYVSLSSGYSLPNCADIAADAVIAVRGCSDPDNRHKNCELLENAGASPLVIDTNVSAQSGTYTLSVQEFLAIPGLRDVEVMFYENDLAREFLKEGCTAAFDELFGNITAWTTGEVYDITRTAADSGSPSYDLLDYFEGAEAEPDVLLQDFIEAIHPGTVSHTRRFMRKAKAPNLEEKQMLTAEDCVDRDAPLITGWTSSPCNPNLVDLTIPGLEKLQAADICVGSDAPAPVVSTTGCDEEEGDPDSATSVAISLTLFAFTFFVFF